MAPIQPAVKATSPNYLGGLGRISRIVRLLFLAVLLAGAGARGQTPTLCVEEWPTGETVLSVCGHPAFRVTTNTVSDETLTEVAAPNVLTATWSEWDGTTRRPFYAVTRDGGETFPAMQATSYDLRLKYATFDPAIESLNVESTLLADPSCTLHIVQFISPSMEEYRAAVTEAGGVIRGFLPNHAHLVEIDDADVAQLADLPFVRTITPYHPAYRLEPYLRDNLGNLAQAHPTGAYNIMVAERGLSQKTAVADRIAQMGGSVEPPGPGGFLLMATLTPEQLQTVVTYNEVVYVDRVGEVVLLMDIVREVSGANYVSSLPGVPGYTGEGVRGMVIDDGLYVNHVAFTNSPPTVIDVNGNQQSHGTAVYGIVFGDGTSAPVEHGGLLPAHGIVPNAEGFFLSYFNLTDTREYCFACQNMFGWRDCVNLGICYLGDPSAPFQSVFQSRSFGFSLSIDYGSRSFVLDDIVFAHDLTLCQAQGNCGNHDKPGCGVPELYHGRLSATEAWAKNVVSVGAVLHAHLLADDPNNPDGIPECDLGNIDDSDDEWNWNRTRHCPFPVCPDYSCEPSWASKGPAEDGRVKPDLIGFYDAILTPAGPDFADEEWDPTTYDSGFGGTSAATPQVCGMFGLFYQMWADGLFGNPYDPAKSVFENRPHAMTAKAMMINTARRYDWYDVAPTDANADITRDVQGWGMPNVRKLYNIAVRGGFLLIVDESAPVSLVSHAHVYWIEDVPEDAYSLNITLVWRDPPGNPASQIARINDLNLGAESAGGPEPVFYVGNAGLVGGGATNWSLGFGPDEVAGPWDSVNTVENIFVPYPRSGRWQIHVSAHEVNVDAYPQTPEWDVPYSLVVSVDFDCNGNGVPDSEETGPIETLWCPQGGVGGGHPTDPPSPELPVDRGPGAEAQ